MHNFILYLEFDEKTNHDENNMMFVEAYAFPRDDDTGDKPNSSRGY